MTKKKLSQLGRYRIRGELGRGAMGVVYKADDPALDRTVALKTINLSDDTEGRAEYEARFLREAKAAGRLTHPHIITIHDFGEEGDLAYMAMELLKGTELRARMLQGAIPIREAIEIAAQVADGLGYAHEHGVVHRDIKPSNIMLVGRGQVKIMDFGVARMRVSDLKTSTGVVLGTPRYMSPEQVAGLPVDHRTDIFSLGIVLYEMLTGSPLFAGEDMPQIMHKVSKLEQAPPSRVNPEVPPMLDFILARALKKDPDVRYQDAYELAADLRSCLVELGGGEAKKAKADDNSSTKTIKLDPGAAKALHIAPAAGAIASDTLLPLSVRFDSSAAVQRFTAPSKRDQVRLARAPRPVGFWRRLISDPRRRRLAAIVAAAAALGALIAFA
jgi:serine/threonine-protein kinase